MISLKPIDFYSIENSHQRYLTKSPIKTKYQKNAGVEGDTGFLIASAIKLFFFVYEHDRVILVLYYYLIGSSAVSSTFSTPSLDR